MSLVLCVYQFMWCCSCTVRGCTGSSSWSDLVINVLSVSWSSELLLSFSAPRNTSTPLLMRTTSSPLTHDQHTQCYWTTLYISCMLSVQYREITNVRVYNMYVRVCVCLCMGAWMCTMVSVIRLFHSVLYILVWHSFMILYIMYIMYIMLLAHSRSIYSACSVHCVCI